MRTVTTTTTIEDLRDLVRPFNNSPHAATHLHISVGPATVAVTHRTGLHSHDNRPILKWLCETANLDEARAAIVEFMPDR